jgi:serine/threonine protein kinase
LAAAAPLESWAWKAFPFRVSKEYRCGMASSPELPNSARGSFPRKESASPGDVQASEVTQGAGILLFSRYRVERELGRGGMGRVVLAYDTKLHLPVALKLVPDQLVPDTEAINDLRLEVHRGMALLHPSILRTHTLELDEGGAAIVMEYVDGQTLAELKERQPGRCFDPEQILPWLESLCAVLDYAHRDARIVHRDLKPRNLMVTRDGRLKVADFGIAATITDTLTRQTGQQSASGTPAYMSPQQARGKKPSHLDDVYSLGATIYDLLTSKPPFLRGNILLQVLEEIPHSMTDRRVELEIHGKATIPAVWERVVAACLMKDASQRPQSAGEVLMGLRGDERSQSPALPPPIPTVQQRAPEPLRPPPLPASSVPTMPTAQPGAETVRPAVSIELPSAPRRRSRTVWVLLALLLIGSLAVIPLYHFVRKAGTWYGDRGLGVSNPWLTPVDFAGTWRGPVIVDFTMQSGGETYAGQGSTETIVTVSPAGDNVVRENGAYNWYWTKVPPGYLQSGTDPAVIIGPYNVAMEDGKLAWRYDFTNSGWTMHVEVTLALSEDKSTATFVSTASGTHILTGARETNVHRAILTRSISNSQSPIDSLWNVKK